MTVTRWVPAVTLATAFVTATVSTMVAAPPAAAGAPAPIAPNVITILADDLGYADTSLYAGTISTPNIDRLAARGVTFTQATVGSPVCAPSRMALLSGREPAQVHADSNYQTRHHPADLSGPDGDGPTVAQLLQRQGYRTMAIGKWDISGVTQDEQEGDVDGTEPNLPHRAGFDDFWGILAGISPYCPERKPNTFRYDPATDSYRDAAPSRYLTDELTEHAVDFVGAQAGGPQPFYLYLAYNAPHGPLHTRTTCTAPSDELDRRQRYTEMVQTMDEGIGRVIDRLDAVDGLVGNLDDANVQNTIITFASDNGPEHDWQTGPLRDRKYTLFEGGIRVPLVVTWPAALPEGATSDQQVSTLDLLPTYAAAAGAPVRGYPGRDLRTVVGADPSVGPRVWRYYSDSASRGVPRSTSRIAVRDGDVKYLRDVEPDGAITEYLFDLGRDYDGDGTPDGHREDHDEIANPQYRPQLAGLRRAFRTWANRTPLSQTFHPVRADGVVDGYATLGAATWAADAGATAWQATAAGDGYAIASATYFADVDATARLAPATTGTGGVVVAAALGRERQLSSGVIVAVDRDREALTISRVTDGSRVEVARQRLPGAAAVDSVRVEVRDDVVTARAGQASISWRTGKGIDGGAVGLYAGQGSVDFLGLAAQHAR